MAVLTELVLAARLPAIGTHFHGLMVILSAVAMIFSCLVTTYLICGHYFHWVISNSVILTC